jgi:hypothetical protein
MSAQPLDKKKWAAAKKMADTVYKTHSAYKSGYIVLKYKELGGEFTPTPTPKPNTGLSRWFSEKWVNQHGTTGYQHKNDVYRPSKRITSKTPTTWKELTPSEIAKAKKIKASGKRVVKFKSA